MLHQLSPYDGEKEVIFVNLNGRCHLEPLSLSRVTDNPLLAVSIRDDDVQHCMRGIEQYGLLDPLVLSRGEDGRYIVVSGSCELQALRKMKVKQTDAVVIAGLNVDQIHQLSLHLLSLRSSKDPLAEALLVQKLLQDGKLSQSDVAMMVGRSVSWVSKRALLAERLDPSVQTMVMDKILSARTAQEIAKLPPQSQHSFATRVVSESMPKSAVEHLVATYNRADTTLAVKRQILESPRQALPYCTPKKQVRPLVTLDQDVMVQNKRLHNCIRLLFKLTSELESLWGEVPIPEAIRNALHQALERLNYLENLEFTFAPGQKQEGEYYAN